nr:MAG TPA: hypothetical protein [Caudoviricetes sp.]
MSSSLIISLNFALITYQRFFLWRWWKIGKTNIKTKEIR